jgi:hypothetical protein
LQSGGKGSIPLGSTNMMYTTEQQQANREKWAAALESGAYKQGRGRLKDDEDNFCVLGVACDLAMKEGILNTWQRGCVYEGSAYLTECAKNMWFAGAETTMLPQIVADWLGVDTHAWVKLPSGKLTSLWELNDGTWATANSFEELAGLIRANRWYSILADGRHGVAQSS